MLQDMELWTDVRRALFVEKISKREACLRFDLTYYMVDQISRSECPGSYQRASPASPKLGPYISFIECYLEEDKSLPVKQRHTKRRIYERLRDEHGYSHGERTVSDYLLKRERSRTAEFIPLSHPHGQAQFDFGFAHAVLGGIEQQVSYAAISLLHSNVRYVQAFPRECTETFQEALKRFFHFLGGVPRTIYFDNSKVNVAKIVGRRGETASDALLKIASCYLFEPKFCRIYEPQEKGHVENAVGYVRRNFMVPLPRFSDFASFNAHLEDRCREEFSKTSSMQTKAIGELFDEEKHSLLPLPETDFETHRVEIRRADSLSLIRFDCNDYSVPAHHTHKEFTVLGSIDAVRFCVDGEIVAEHQRDWGKKGRHYNPIHYLAIAERRPNGLDFGAPFADWDLPSEFEVLRRRLESSGGSKGKREYIRILRLLERFSLDQLTRSISKALSMNTTAYDGIRVLIESEHDASLCVEFFCLDGRPQLQQVKLPEPSMSVYSTLLEDRLYEETRNETDRTVETSLAAVETSELRA
jgi:transposase